MTRVLIAVPLLQQAGGVANYYRALRLDRTPAVQYLEVTGDQRTALAVTWRLLTLYARFFRSLGGVDSVLLNPSMGSRAIVRDAVLAWLALARGKNLLVFWRGWDWQFFNGTVVRSKFLLWLMRRTLTRAHTTVVLADVFERELRKINPEARGRFVRETTVADDTYLQHSTVDLAQAKASLAPPTLLFMSRLEPDKGLVEALRAFALVRRQHPDVRFVVAGEGSELARARDLVAAEGIGGVSFVGHVEGARKHEILLQASLLLFPTRFGEGMPNVVLEAMLYGLPVVATRNAGIVDAVQDGINGLLRDGDDAGELAAAVLAILDDARLRERMISANLERARLLFTPAVVRERILRLLQCPQ
jgi:glycosyltransferase involved in cell wall biosynthesis